MFEARIAELNRFNEQNPVSYDKRTYTVDEIQDILGISRPTAYNLVQTYWSLLFVFAWLLPPL